MSVSDPGNIAPHLQHALNSRGIPTKLIERDTLALLKCLFCDDQARVTLSTILPTYRCTCGKSIQDLADAINLDLYGDAFPAISGTELCEGDFSVEWYVRNFLVKGDPGLWGGVFKVLKTSGMMETGISVVTGSPVFGTFEVLQRANVLFISGESGKPNLKNIAERIRRSKNLTPHDLANLTIVDQLPKLSDAKSCARLAATIAKHRAGIVMIDPAYLCLGGSGHSDVLEMGPLLNSINTLCRDLGTTLILAHHAVKSAARTFKPPQLGDLSQAGFAEFAAQWFLVGRREEYRPNTPHQLWLNVGGRAGHSALYHLDIDEGSIDDPGGRKWEVVIGDGYAALESDRLKKWCARVLLNLRDGGEVPTSLAAKGCGKRADQQAVLDYLVAEKRIECIEKTERKKSVHYYRLAA